MQFDPREAGRLVEKLSKSRWHPNSGVNEAAAMLRAAIANDAMCTSTHRTDRERIEEWRSIAWDLRKKVEEVVPQEGPGQDIVTRLESASSYAMSVHIPYLLGEAASTILALRRRLKRAEAARDQAEAAMETMERNRD